MTQTKTSMELQLYLEEVGIIISSNISTPFDKVSW